MPNKVKRCWTRFKSFASKKGHLSVIITVFVNLIGLFTFAFLSGDNSWRIYALLISCFFAVGTLLVLLSEKESILSFVLKWKYRLQLQNTQLNEENVRLNIIGEHKDLIIRTQEAKLSSNEYRQNCHAFRAMTNYLDLAFIFNQIQDIEAVVRDEYSDMVNQSYTDKQSKSAKNEMSKKAGEKLELVLGDVARFLTKSSLDDDFEVIVSLYYMTSSSKPTAQNYCANTSKITFNKKELRRTQSFYYPIMDNSDFHWVYEKVNNFDEHGEPSFFYCRNDLTNETLYRDSNHKYYNLDNKKKATFEYKKGENEFILPYKSLITSAIYDVKNTSSDPQKINGFLSVSSETVDCFTRSDTLILQVISVQLNNIFTFLK